MELTEDIARHFARTALGHVARPYPYKDDHVFEGEHDVRPPREAHPVFFGSFDWHSCVHGWWTLLSLRRLYPGMPEAAEIAALADNTFTEEKLAVELAYLGRTYSRAFERPYGWAWLLYLHHEAARHSDKDWGARLEPLARAFAGLFRDYLRILTYPITVGSHYNSAFALTLAREWALERDCVLVATIDEWALAAYGRRRDYAGWEPGGDEFLSPVLSVALLMSRIMPQLQYAPWLDGLVLSNGWVERECRPVTVSDRSDGKIAHLDGLNLSRAWNLRAASRALGDHSAQELLEARAQEHLEAAMPHVAGDYMGEHWLASFALLALLEKG
ncbi:DUF2891 domain-containing protein [Qipengyuania gaetbuli]|uniref:DUF2891 domain-containing protein n=1 Tax=Qipengyuania gaetbuli TaxID=266952 RepID=UPI001CFDDE19|nr:DUF2891 domain-containing protein [Qipengyuania gaetbuli]